MLFYYIIWIFFLHVLRLCKVVKDSAILWTNTQNMAHVHQWWNLRVEDCREYIFIENLRD